MAFTEPRAGLPLLAAEVDNDTRGWIMSIVSGIACVFGASIICVDVVVRLFPGKHNFRIQESSIFLACSLSLSFGVMLFSSLYSMLPESRQYLKDKGWADQSAGFVMMGCFIGGFIGIQAISRFLHQYMPSHVVDCDHSHDDDAAAAAAAAHARPSSCGHSHRQQSRVSRARRRLSINRPAHSDAKGETTPLLLDVDRDCARDSSARHATASAAKSSRRLESAQGAANDEMAERPASPLVAAAVRRARTAGDLGRRPSMYDVQKRVMSFVKDTKCNCDEEGDCYGYTDPCGQECFKHLAVRSSHANNNVRQPTLLRTTTGPFYPQSASVFHGSTSNGGHEAGSHHQQRPDGTEPLSPMFRTSRAASREPFAPTEEDRRECFSLHRDSACDAEHVHNHELDNDTCHGDEQNSHTTELRSCSSMQDGDIEAQHHHHVPTNAFLSIGLQTSIAIALHKFPEGFITYATNHANPTLGFNVFMALFVHNITEGFALALPLYMALGSRWRAMLWSALLGGLSQPVGAAIAALWFRLARRTHMTPNAVAYACLFAATAGIMVSVALQLFVESLSLNHNRNLCIFFGFIGMALLGLSNALFTGH
ncbi:hypothetical protein CDD82_5211 [Ophiocordyceps australis]|uniref:Uncharacterized protein n=1 Tax=Ophiocordyceps australis TaxID=1399860 RepID=A0A2C5ZTK1_9HYPO|nr:hypothetical protein CDD82_5211 [Ophiocordyceps australis]